MISLGAELSLFVTNLDSEGPLLRLWAQIDKPRSLRVEKLMLTLTPQFNNGRGIIKNRSALAQNAICCAMFEQAYYRARISSIHQSGEIVVQFIDYGNMEILQESDIRLIDDIPDAIELGQIPPLAAHFIIADVLPKGNAIEWDTQILTKILKNIRYNTYCGKIETMDKASHFLRMNYNGNDFAKILINEHLARAASPEEIIEFRAMVSSTPVQPSVPPVIHRPRINQNYESLASNYGGSRQALRMPRQLGYAEDRRGQPQTDIPPPRIASQVDDACVFRTRFLEIGSRHDVKVSYVEDGPLMFSVQVNSTAEELMNLMRGVNALEPRLLTEAPESGTVCLGRHSVDGSLMRAVITQVRKDECKLHYVDFGRFEVLPHTQIYVLPKHLINPRCLSIRVTMSNVNDLIVTDELKRYFKTYVTGKNFVLEVKSPEERSLIQCGDLYDNGHNVKDILRSMYGSSRWLPPCALVNNSKEIVQVVNIDRSIIHVQLDSEAPQLEKLARHIEQNENAPIFKPSQIKKGTHCVALSSLDSRWYRAEILESIGNDVKVFFVDYGKEETIPATSIRQIRDKAITQLRAQAIRCTINDYVKEITTSQLRDSLAAQLRSKSVAMTVNRITPATGPIVDLFDCNTEPLVNIIKRLKRASIVNGNISARLEIYKNPMYNNSNVDRSDDQTNKWNSGRSESSRTVETNSRKEDDNDPRRFDDRYHTRDTEWPPNNAHQQSGRFSRNDGKNDRFASRDSPRYDRQKDRNGDTNVNSRGRRDNRERGGRDNFGNTRNNGNNSRNASVENTWSDKDSDTSSRGSGRSGGRRRSSAGKGGRRDSDNDRQNLKNAWTNGASPRTRDNKRDFGDKIESQRFETWTNKPELSLPRFVIPGPNIGLGAVKNCELVYMKNPTDFHVQLNPDNQELDTIMASIATTYENGGKILDGSSIVQGLDCVARYSEDSIWYRANILSIEANGAKVRFVDYGNVEIVDFDKIKELEKNIAKLPAQAIACKLLAAKKSNWESSEIEKFGNLIDGKPLEAEFVAQENNVYEIVLREIVDGTPSTILVNDEFSNGTDIASAKIQARSKNRSPRGNYFAPTDDYASIDEKWPVEEIGEGSKQNIIVTWFVNPDNLYCQSLARKDEFRSMMTEIQEIHASRIPVAEQLQIGSPVLAVFSEDGALYRAEILELNKSRGSIVRYVDFGNTAMVEHRNIYRVEKKFIKLPKQAANCSLKNIVPANGGSWSKSNKQEIEKCFDAENFECTFHELKDGKYTISLRNRDIDVAGLLVEKNFASFAVSRPVEIVEEVSETTPQPEIEELPRFDISLLAGQILRARVSNVASAAKFYIQLPSANASDKVIDAYMTKNDPKVMPRLSNREVCLGAGCLVNTDEGWRRAVVVNCARTTGFDVRLIDTGANDEIPLESMLALPGELSVMQNQAIECCLTNATTTSIGLDDEKLRERIENTDVVIAVEEVDNNRLIVKLYDENGIGIKMDEADQDETICPICPMPVLYSTQKVVVIHADNSSSVWLKRLVDFDADAELLARLYDHYSVPRDRKNFAVFPGTLCAAKSSDDNWYRARILYPTILGGAKVEYIDYGNSEDVEYTSMNCLEPQFMVQSQLAIRVSLTVKLGGSIDQQREILKNEILNREFVATMYNVRKKWIAELTNSEGKMSEKLSKLEAIEVSKKPEVQNDIPEMMVGKRYKVTCIAADSPASFWLQRNEEMSAIEQLQERLQIDATDCPVLKSIPEEKSLCLAMYSVDGQWYRAEVIDADEDITTVLFIDFGNTDIVDTNQGKSKIISDSLTSIKRYATKCRLDVIPFGCEDWSTAACEWFEGIATSLDNMEALVIADSSPKRVDLLVDDKSITEELVKRNYATKINTEDDLIEELIEREVDPRAAYVSHVISPNEFWIQQEKYVGDLEVLADRCIVAEMFPKIKESKKGSLCVAQFPEDHEWYRARILSHAETGTEVIYIDYGNSAVSTEIREIPEDLAVQPPFSKKCRLVLPDGIEQWSDEACTEFVKIAAEGATIFQLDVLEDNDDTSIVRLTRDGQDIVELLTSVTRIEERLPPLGEENLPNVLISHVDSPSDFNIQAESAIGDLETMAEHLAAADNFLPLDNIKDGIICAAKFPEDEQWYRAKILSHGDSGTEVLYIDYGNSAVTTELRVLPDDIVKAAPLSKSCSLLMPDHVESWSKEACQTFFEIADAGITMFGYEIIDDREKPIVRLIVDGKDIVETLAPLCEKKNSPITEETTELRKSETEVSNEDKISSNESSGIDVVTNSDESTTEKSNLDGSTNSATIRVSESIIVEEIIDIVRNSNDNKTVVNENETRIADSEKNDDMKNLFFENNNNRIIDNEETIGEKKKKKIVDTRNSENDEKIPKTSLVEKILPGSISRGLSDSEIIIESIDRRTFIPSEDKIVPGSINKGVDMNFRESESVRRPLDHKDEISLDDARSDEETSPLLARRLSFGDKILPGSISRDDSPSVEIPTTPKTPHSEKLVAGVVNPQSEFDDSEKDEILVLVSENNIPE